MQKAGWSSGAKNDDLYKRPKQMSSEIAEPSQRPVPDKLVWHKRMQKSRAWRWAVTIVLLFCLYYSWVLMFKSGETAQWLEQTNQPSLINSPRPQTSVEGKEVQKFARIEEAIMINCFSDIEWVVFSAGKGRFGDPWRSFFTALNPLSESWERNLYLTYPSLGIGREKAEPFMH